MGHKNKPKYILSFGQIYFTLWQINNMALKQMSPGEYGKIVGKSKQAILYRIQNSLSLPGVSIYETMVGGRHILTVDVKKAKSGVNNYFRKTA